MGIKKYVSIKDSTITDAARLNLIDRAQNANMGGSESLEIFSIYGQMTSTSLEKSRIVIQFPIDSIISDRNSSKIPASGSVNFFLTMFNAEHPFTVPQDFTLLVSPLSRSWDEGSGLDMETYADLGWNADTNGSGCTWQYASSGTVWTTYGGDFLTSSQYIKSASFSSGIEDLSVDITNIVESWIQNTIPNYGLIIRLSGSQEDGTETRSYYTKKFFARNTDYFFKKPCIEAKWASAIQDDRKNFFASSSALSADDNKMNLYFFNKPKGTLKNINGNIVPNVKFYTDTALTNEISSSFLSVSNPSAGVYKATVAINTTASYLYDKWYNSSSLGTYFTGYFDINTTFTYENDQDSEYIVNISNLKNSYADTESVKFKIFSRLKDWAPTIYTVASTDIENTVINNLYYKIFRLSDNYTVVDYSTGSLAYSKTSYDSSGNYFELDMNLLQKNYAYGIKLATYDGNELVELQPVFKFRVQ